jgi:hypothetical protein
VPRLRDDAAIRQHISVGYLGQRWVSAGAAVPFESRDLVQIGEYAGVPVYTARGLKEDVIYLRAAGGRVAPYQLTD